MSTPAAINRFVPAPDQFAWTFGGVEPIMRVRPREVLDLYTEDAFGGKIRSSSDLPSTSIEYPFINPQTGPFYVEGAEPATRSRSTSSTSSRHATGLSPPRSRCSAR